MQRPPFVQYLLSISFSYGYSLTGLVPGIQKTEMQPVLFLWYRRVLFSHHTTMCLPFVIGCDRSSSSYAQLRLMKCYVYNNCFYLNQAPVLPAYVRFQT